MDREKIKANLLGMETALTTYHKLGQELEELTTNLTPEEETLLEGDTELSNIAERLDKQLELFFN